eukprot:GHRR01017705.1.p1 GENE.GHRR01017705.1~~GHRR01017705.1.p1  ORF type:complete len:148 (-),score=55.51 GHRR01017705.1:1161-1604(-)
MLRGDHRCHSVLAPTVNLPLGAVQVANCLVLLQVGVGGGMKSGVAYWRVLKTVKDIHPCWAHLKGMPLQEFDLPRPISNDYKSIFDLPATRTAEEQAKALAAASAAPRVTSCRMAVSAGGPTVIEAAASAVAESIKAQAAAAEPVSA